MFDNNYICEPKGIPFVAYYKEFDECPGRVFTHLHFHDDFEFLYIVKGCANMQIGGKEYTVSEGTLAVVNPYETHYCEQKDGKLAYYCFDFGAAMLDLPRQPELLSESIRYGNIIKSVSIEPLVKSAFEAYSGTPVGWQLAVRGSLLMIFSLLESTVTENFGKSNDFVKNTLRYIDQNLQSNITSKTAAAYMGYEQSYFCRSFKKHFKCKFGDYLNICRVEKAKSLMYTHNITQIALLCGFSGSSAFSQVFKKYTGVCPSEYKSKLKGAAS